MSEGAPALLVRLSASVSPHPQNETVDHESNESADGEAAGGQWQARDFLSFVHQKTHQERDVADVSQMHPITSFAQNVPGMCQADEAPEHGQLIGSPPF
jgi:hypothetical protein